MNHIVRMISLTAVSAFLAGCQSPDPDPMQAILHATTFHASFDQGVDADHGKGDRRLHWAASMKQPRVGQPGLPPGGVVSLAPGEGRHGNALRFHKKAAEMVFFPAKGNLEYQTAGWNGSFSLWLRTGPDTDLAMGYTDPIQITPRDWNDASFFVEFERRKDDVPFRLGAYADLKVWNPDNRKWDDIPAGEKPLITVNPPPIARDRWMHVVVTFENFNTGKPDGIAHLYLNGEPRGQISQRLQTYVWDMDKTLMMLGLGYIGYLDEFSVFDRTLTPGEVRLLNGLQQPLAGMLAKSSHASHAH